MKLNDFLSELLYTDDPWAILGITPGAGDEAIRRACTACLEKTSDEDRVRRVETAYRRIENEEQRIRHELLSPVPLEKSEELLYLVKARPRYAGPGIWLKTIRELAAQQPLPFQE